MDEVQRIKNAYSKRKIKSNATYPQYFSQQRERSEGISKSEATS